MNKGYPIYAFGTPRSAVILALQKLNKDQIDKAIGLYKEKNTLHVGTVLGVSDDGVFFSEADNWHPEMEDAFGQIGMAPWVQVHELLGNVPEGTTGEFLKTGISH